MKKVIYYSDKCKQDFAGTHINAQKISDDYKYVNENIFYKAMSFLVYKFLVFPLVWFYERVILGVKIYGKENIKNLEKSAFLYGNHIGFFDAFTPNVLSMPKRRNMIVTSADAVSIKGLSTLVKMLGAIPVPDTLHGVHKFKSALAHYSEKCNITIYPEAHIWPYYTGVREFSDSSFTYPVELSLPVVAFFTAFEPPHRLTFWRKATIKVYVSKPFFPDEKLSPKDARRWLCDEVYSFMKDCSEKYSTYEVIEYREATKKNEN